MKVSGGTNSKGPKEHLRKLFLKSSKKKNECDGRRKTIKELERTIVRIKKQTGRAKQYGKRLMPLIKMIGKQEGSNWGNV